MKINKIIIVLLVIVIIIGITSFVTIKLFVKKELVCNSQQVYKGNSNSIGSCDDICKNAGELYFNTNKMFCTGAKNIVEENGVVKNIYDHACNDVTIDFPKTCNCCTYK